MTRKTRKLPQNEMFAPTSPAPAGDGLQGYPPEVVEQLRHMVTRITRGGNLSPRLSIVSSLRGEGVSYLSRALAALIANDLATSICWVDLNFWWHSTSWTPANGGLSALYRGDASLEEIIQNSVQPNLAWVYAGDLEMEKRPVIARSQFLRHTLDDLNNMFDHLILDVPAVLAVTDAVPLASLGTACCLVVRQGVTHIDDVRRTLDELYHLPIIGVILNQVRYAMPGRLQRLIVR